MSRQKPEWSIRRFACHALGGRKGSLGVPVSLPWLQVQSKDEASKVGVALLLFPSECKASSNETDSFAATVQLTLERGRAESTSESEHVSRGSLDFKGLETQTTLLPAKQALQTAVEWKEAKSETLPAPDNM